MKNIKNIKHLTELLTDEKKKHKPLINNCYLMPNKLDELALNNRLFYEIHDDGILLFSDMGYYYNMYFYIKPDKGSKVKMKEKPIVVEFHDSEARHNKQNDITIPYWGDNGFIHNATVRRMSTDYDQAQIDELINAHETAYEVITAKEAHFERIFELLLDAFDPIENLFVSKEDMLNEMKNGEFQCIVDENDEVMCAIQSSIKNDEFNMHHVVVDPAHRGKNLSWHLRKTATENAWNLGIKKRVGWVLEGNTPGIVSAQKIGLKFDGRFTIQYILKQH